MRIRSILDVTMSGEGVIRRRMFLRTIGAGALALPFGSLLAARAEELRARRKACILLWMAGGPSQFETFDPKPDHANGGGTPTIQTAVPGVRIAAGWEKTAAALSEIALIRSLTNREGNHARASYQLHTGYLPTGTLKHPSLGANVAAELGDPAVELPHFVAIGGPTQGAGFLGAAYEPFAVLNPERPPANAVPPVPGERLERRLGLLGDLEAAGYAQRGGADRVRDHQTLYRQTAAMVRSPRMAAFDLDQEDATLRDAYGRTPFGQGCLLARRLVEAGVTFVEVRSNGWDTHTENAERVSRLASTVDPALATLVSDLKTRGLLDSTLVIWMGEFGRTPRVNPRAGRDHYPRAFNAAVAGCGIQGGQVIGATSPDGTEVTDRPISIPDLLATFCQALGIDYRRENMSPVGRPIRIVDGGTPVSELFA
ncbi:MAG: hypothetical protein KatS3mg108_0364 [Isosphaeraceae bacterium]|jgi:hypothetical protein|nr:MAG: hypothetical protein KatS3mg108_0364 [Isosphaeraceae bacterium]